MPAISPAAALQYAAEHIFSMGLGDAAARMSEMNMTYGLAKMHHVQSLMGDEPDAVFIGTPDVTITRNLPRWNAGIGYGGKLVWGDGSRPYCFPDVKPNACGMLVGGMDEMPAMTELARELNAFISEPAELDGVKLQWDLGVGNHFIDVMAVEPVQRDLDLPPYAFVLHFSGGELRGDNPLGMGLYWHEAPELLARCRTMDTPWGPIHVLEGQNALDYFEFFQRVDDFARRRRQMVADRLFGGYRGYRVITNLHHQGLLSPNAALLGCQDTSQGGLAPIMLRESTPGYLFEVLPNLDDDIIEVLGWRERAEKHGVMDVLRSADVIPHGAGYMLEGVAEVIEVVEVGDHRYFRVRAGEGDVEILIGSPRDL
ncbi:MAG: hypothetical protein J7M38_01155, partial [Armatimonadetes bacterium]|nr:hypothetical protein [Armatimonadota bacterium]